MGEPANHRVVIAGGTGLVGRLLVKRLLEQCLKVQVLSRNPQWAQLPPGAEARPWKDLPELLEGSLAVINLAGEGIADRRWNRTRKNLLLESRVTPTRTIVRTLRQTAHPPSVLVNASAIGFYGALGEAAVDEGQAPGNDFLAQVCQAWEAEADGAKRAGLRVVKLRIGPVLAREGGALPKLALPVRLFAGCALGSGRQGFSWIHIEDLVQLILECLRNPAFEGPINATAPHPCSNAAFTRLLARHLQRPVWPVPGFLTRGPLRLLMGEMAEPMLLGGAFVLPKKALDLGFAFRFPDAAQALKDLL
jgi:hypothetical protein